MTKNGYVLLWYLLAKFERIHANFEAQQRQLSAAKRVQVLKARITISYTDGVFGSKPPQELHPHTMDQNFCKKERRQKMNKNNTNIVVVFSTKAWKQYRTKPKNLNVFLIRESFSALCSEQENNKYYSGDLRSHPTWLPVEFKLFGSIHNHFEYSYEVGLFLKHLSSVFAYNWVIVNYKLWFIRLFSERSSRFPEGSCKSSDFKWDKLWKMKVVC